MVGGPGDHPVHAHEGCRRTNEKPLLWPGRLHLLTREQQLHLPGWPAAELRRPQQGKPHVRLHRNAQEVRSVPTEIAVHNRTVPISCHPHERSSSTARERSLEYRGIQIRTTSTEKGRSALRGTKESYTHRPPTAPASPVEVRPRAVLPGGHCPEHQTASPVPKPTDTITNARQRIVAGTGGNVARRPFASPKSSNGRRLFQHPQANALSDSIVRRNSHLCSLNFRTGLHSIAHPDSVFSLLAWRGD